MLLASLDREGKIEWAAAFLDGSFVSSKKGAMESGAPRLAKASRVMLVADGNGLPIGLLCESAQPHEVSLASRTLATIAIKKQKRGRARTGMTELVADKGFDSAAFRRELTKRGIKNVHSDEKIPATQKTRTAAALF